MNAMCKVIIIKVLQRIFGLWFHEITHICNIYLLNPTSLANQEMLISTMILVWNGSKNYLRWGAIIFHPIWAFFLIEICRKTLILGPRWFTKSNGYALFFINKIFAKIKSKDMIEHSDSGCHKNATLVLWLWIQSKFWLSQFTWRFHSRGSRTRK